MEDPLAAAKTLFSTATRSSRVEGEVRRFTERYEPGRDNKQWTVWSFVLESFDAAGNRQRPIPVEMRAIRFRGSIHEGDKVRITKFTRAGGVIKASELSNETTGSIVRGLGSTMWPPPMWVWNLIWIAGIILVILLIISSIQ
jgi:hypothetical protein